MIDRFLCENIALRYIYLNKKLVQYSRMDVWTHVCKRDQILEKW